MAGAVLGSRNKTGKQARYSVEFCGGLAVGGGLKGSGTAIRWLVC